MLTYSNQAAKTEERIALRISRDGTFSSRVVMFANIMVFFFSVC